MGLAAFAKEYSATVLREYEWRGNLDQFNDILRGGFGSPEGGFVLRLRHADAARLGLGYAETARWFEEQAQSCHPSNREHMLSRMNEARVGVGQTLLELVLEIIRDHGPGGDEADDGISVELVDD